MKYYKVDKLMSDYKKETVFSENVFIVTKKDSIGRIRYELVSDYGCYKAHVRKIRKSVVEERIISGEFISKAKVRSEILQSR